MGNEMIGMDPDAIAALANTMRTSAARLRTIQSSVTGKVHSSPWHGHVADRFRTEWTRTYSRSLAAAANDLTAAAEALTRNANEQRTASSADGGAIGGGAAPVAVRAGVDVNLLGALWEPTKLGFERLGVLAGGLGVLGHLMNSAPRGAYTKLFAGLQKATQGDPLLYYKRLPIVQGLYAQTHGGALANSLDFAGKHGFFDKIGKAGIALDLVEAGGDLASRDFEGAATNGTEVLASKLKMSANPISYLSGVATSVWVDNYEMVRDNPLDLSAKGLKMALDEGPKVWAEEFGKATVKTFTKLPKFFL